MFKVIGLCGGSGSGKAVVGKFFSEFGYYIIDTDKLYRDMTQSPSPCLLELTSVFGKEILNSDGGLERSALSEIVFNNKEKLLLLNSISHRFILSKVREIIASLDKKSFKGAIVDAPLLFESGFDRECDLVIAVIADKSVRVERIVKRDSITVQKAELRIDSQIDSSELKKRADYVITNNSSYDEIKKQIIQILTYIEKEN